MGNPIDAIQWFVEPLERSLDSARHFVSAVVRKFRGRKEYGISEMSAHRLRCTIIDRISNRREGDLQLKALRDGLIEMRAPREAVPYSVTFA